MRSALEKNYLYVGFQYISCQSKFSFMLKECFISQFKLCALDKNLLVLVKKLLLQYLEYWLWLES